MDLTSSDPGSPGRSGLRPSSWGLLLVSVGLVAALLLWILVDAADSSGDSRLDALAALWGAAGTWILTVATVVSLITLNATYGRAKTLESARFWNTIHDRWFFSPELRAFRNGIENDQIWALFTSPTLERALEGNTKPSMIVGEGELVESAPTIEEIDVGLSYLEFVLQLRNIGVVEQNHMEPFVCFWVDSLLRHPSRRRIREYIFAWGWTALQQRLMEDRTPSAFSDQVELEVKGHPDDGNFRLVETITRREVSARPRRISDE